MIIYSGKNVSMIDVAAVAGVSQATVSRTLHAPESVKPATRERILKAMHDIGYVYNSVAADFTKQKNSTIGLIVFTLRSSIQSELIEGIQEELDQSGYSLIIGNSRYNPTTERNLLQAFHERHLSGIIVAESTDENREILTRISRTGVPVVLTWEMPDDTSLDCVGIDNFKAARRMTEYLLKLGHRRIGLIAGPFNHIERVRQRLRGYHAALEAAGIQPENALVISTIPSILDGKAAMSQLLSLPNRPSAVFAASDALALGALAAARESDFRVPEDISICGFDDTELAAFSCPPLTTIRVPSHEMGRRAARAVIEHNTTETDLLFRIELETEIVVRSSCSAPSEGAHL